eukprot:4038471-Alexandrium_andersonii.AAC.1
MQFPCTLARCVVHQTALKQLPLHTRALRARPHTQSHAHDRRQRQRQRQRHRVKVGECERSLVILEPALQ